MVQMKNYEKKNQFSYLIKSFFASCNCSIKENKENIPNYCIQGERKSSSDSLNGKNYLN